MGKILQPLDNRTPVPCPNLVTDVCEAAFEQLQRWQVTVCCVGQKTGCVVL